MRGAADAANARRQNQAIQYCAADEQILEASVHNTGTPGVGYAVIFDFDPNFEIAFDPIDGKNMYFFWLHLTNRCPYFNSCSPAFGRLNTRLSRF
jgi:hypothetical protein